MEDQNVNLNCIKKAVNKSHNSPETWDTGSLHKGNDKKALKQSIKNLVRMSYIPFGGSQPHMRILPQGTTWNH